MYLPITLGRIIEFIIAWLVSAVIIYIVLKIYPGKQRREDIGGALLAALLGELVYSFFNIIELPLGSLLALVVWLWILKKLFGVGWIGAAVMAFLIYILSLIVSLIGLPHLL